MISTVATPSSIRSTSDAEYNRHYPQRECQNIWFVRELRIGGCHASNLDQFLQTRAPALILARRLVRGLLKNNPYATDWAVRFQTQSLQYNHCGEALHYEPLRGTTTTRHCVAVMFVLHASGGKIYYPKAKVLPMGGGDDGPHTEACDATLSRSSGLGIGASVAIGPDAGARRAPTTKPARVRGRSGPTARGKRDAPPKTAPRYPRTAQTQIGRVWVWAAADSHFRLVAGDRRPSTTRAAR